MATPTDTSPAPTATVSTMVTSSLMVTVTEALVATEEEALEGTVGALEVMEEPLGAMEEDF